MVLLFLLLVVLFLFFRIRKRGQSHSVERSIEQQEALPAQKDPVTVTHHPASSPGAQYLHYRPYENTSLKSLAEIREYIVIDTETTGFSAARDRIVEIAMLKFVNEKLVGEYCTLVNPEKQIHPAVISVNHITNTDVAHAPKYTEIGSAVASFMDGSIIVGHNVTFDLKMLDSLLCECKIRAKVTYVDTLSISRRVDKEAGLEDNKLQTLLEYYGIDIDRAHRARDDAFATNELFQIYRKMGWTGIAKQRDEAMKRRELLRQKKKAEAEEQRKRNEKSPLLNVVFVFTGDYDAGYDIRFLPETVGAVTRQAISKKVDYLVLGDMRPYGGSTVKYRDALAAIENGYKLKIISESEYMTMLQNALEIIQAESSATCTE